MAPELPTLAPGRRTRTAWAGLPDEAAVLAIVVLPAVWARRLAGGAKATRLADTDGLG